MLRIVDGYVYEGKLSDSRWRVTTHDLGTHREASIARCIDWVEDGPLDPDSIAAQVLRGQREDPQAAEKRQANLERAARRAKTRVRRLCKVQGLNTLLTLTYRANQTDLALAKTHLAQFVRRCAALFRGFCYVACFERQKRGAWHVHIATHSVARLILWRGVRVKSFNVLRSIWRGVVGELEGNVDVAKRKKLLRSPAKCAAYISKYVLKAFAEGEDYSKRYQASRAPIPAPVVAEFRDVAAAEFRELVASVVEWVGDGRQLVTAWLSPFGDRFFCAAECPS